MTLLSVVIPSHERYRYARQTVGAVLSIDDDIEVVVSDTSAINPWSDAEVAAAGGRLRVVRPPAGISVVENFEAGLREATGRYICFIGDDDLVTKDILRVVKWASDEEIEAVRCTFPALFYWPDYQHRSLRELYEGTLWVSPYSGRTGRLDAKAALASAAKKLGRGVGEMPRAYCGLVARPLVDRIIHEHGGLFGGVSPDIYSAALISHHAKRVAEIDFPIIIPGASGASTAGQSAAGRHVGKLLDNDHIRPFRDLVWHPLVPEFYSVPTVWSYSLVCALVELRGENGLREAGWGRLYAQCLLYHRQYFTETRRAMQAFVSRYSIGWLCYKIGTGLIAEAAWLTRKLTERAALRLGGRATRRMANIPTPADAILATADAVSAGPNLEIGPLL